MQNNRFVKLCQTKNKVNVHKNVNTINRLKILNYLCNKSLLSKN